MINTGDVLRFWSDEAGKEKYHLCLHVDGVFVFINSPKARSYAGDYVVPCSDLPFLPATETGKSIISCSLVMTIPADRLAAMRPVKKGSVSTTLLKGLADFVFTSPVLTEEQREALLDGLGDWL